METPKAGLYRVTEAVGLYDNTYLRPPATVQGPAGAVVYVHATAPYEPYLYYAEYEGLGGYVDGSKLEKLTKK